MKVQRDIRNKLKQADAVYIAGKNWQEITNYQYSIQHTEIDELVGTGILYNSEADLIEREKIIKYFADFDFENDIHTRQACIQPKYDEIGKLAACLSAIQVIIRKGVIELHAFVRSQNYETNFLYDNQTFAIVVKMLSKKLNIYNYKIYVKITSLHIEL